MKYAIISSIIFYTNDIEITRIPVLSMIIEVGHISRYDLVFFIADSLLIKSVLKRFP